jgi:sugar phosphate isomerase/epimerase
MNVRGFDLTYCSNIHAGETWGEVQRAISGALPSVRRHLNASGPFAIGLRLSARAAEELQQPGALADFLAFLRDGDYYVPTINGFPYGAFHGERVKERVYLPDWRERSRVEYSHRLATLLATLLAERRLDHGSVSTVPGAFKGHLRSDDDAAAIALSMLDHAKHLVAIRDQTGVTISLAIEPEPACFIETSAEAITFFERYLFNDTLARQCGVTVDQVRRHIGICFDACHMAVEFEDHAAALANFDRAGIRVPKFQISSALRVTDQNGRDALKRFAEDTYLHQVVEQSNGSLTRYVDLPAAFAALLRQGYGGQAGAGAEWRVHFHVPVFLRSLGVLETTQPDLDRVLELVKHRADKPCLEVETYTWDVLPPEYRTADMSEAIARELAWTRARLEA